MVLGLPQDVQLAHQRLDLVASLVLRGPHQTASEVAHSFNVSVPQLYKLASTAHDVYLGLAKQLR
jgi:hypothetical protein